MYGCTGATCAALVLLLLGVAAAITPRAAGAEQKNDQRQSFTDIGLNHTWAQVVEKLERVNLTALRDIDLPSFFMNTLLVLTAPVKRSNFTKVGVSLFENSACPPPKIKILYDCVYVDSVESASASEKHNTVALL